ncbi:MAG: DedA family protein [Notoacmeibacter sp.]|nr:DedA family protein [Notoacmeibacter sp.]
MTGGEAGIAGLFASAFTSATLLPGSSEAVLLGLAAAGVAPTALLVAVASFGNVLGSCVNWLMGRSGARFIGKRWFPASPRQLDRASRWYARYGRWSLLASWVPVIGDPITVVAGVLREPFWRFVLIVGLAKTGRYLALALGFMALA